MRTIHGLILVLAASAACAQTPAPTATPAAAAPPLRARIMEFGGALSNDGFKMRDRLWTGKVEPGAPRRLAVNLFRGNHYWFCAAVDPESESPKVSLFGPDGRAVAGLDHRESGLAAVGVTAETTGQYFVEVETAGGPATDFCLLYLFK